MEKWIKVSDMKPTLHKDVLIYAEKVEDNIDIGRYLGDGWGWDSNLYLTKYGKITHWRELPESPQE